MIQITNFEITLNQFDIILAIKSSSYGVLLSVRGSPILHVYDTQNLDNKVLFDTVDNKIKEIHIDKVI